MRVFIIKTSNFYSKMGRTEALKNIYQYIMRKLPKINKKLKSNIWNKYKVTLKFFITN